MPPGGDVEHHFSAHGQTVPAQVEGRQLSQDVVDGSNRNLGFRLSGNVRSHLVCTGMTQADKGFIHGNSLRCDFQVVLPESIFEGFAVRL